MSINFIRCEYLCECICCWVHAWALPHLRYPLSQRCIIVCLCVYGYNNMCVCVLVYICTCAYLDMYEYSCIYVYVCVFTYSVECYSVTDSFSEIRTCDWRFRVVPLWTRFIGIRRPPHGMIRRSVPVCVAKIKRQFGSKNRVISCECSPLCFS